MINHEGLTFTRDKIDSVLNFPLPRTQKDLKSFLGLANYFREHIPHHSSVAQPMMRLVANYSPGKRLLWDEASSQAFAEMKKLIHSCRKLYFLLPDGQVFLQTDASNNGIGAYLFQRVFETDGSFKDLPIEFISKAFSAEQRRWSTNEQEAYAIFYTLRKLDYLLRDVKFVLQTDRKNLVFVNAGASPKVKRWKLALQEYNFDFEHFAGSRNVVADPMSRLCNLEADRLSDRNLEEDIERASKKLSRMCIFSEDEARNDKRGNEIKEEYLAFLQDERSCDEDLAAYEGPLLHRGVEQFFSLEEEANEALLKHSKNIDVESTPEIQKLIESVHNAYAGHHGVRRTISRLQMQSIKFDHMRAHVTKFIRECPLCQKLSTSAPPPTQTLPFTLASYGTMSRLYIDSIGPLAKDEEGYEHILVVIDAFTRWVMLYPLKSLKAKECAQALMQHFGTFGAASQLTSDGGPQVNNALIHEIISLVGSRHKITLAYSHEENGIVERANKEIGKHLRGFLFEQTVKDTWRTYLPFVQRICNTEVIESIGVSPASILFGSAVDLDRGVFKPNKTFASHEHVNLSEYTNQLIAAQKATIEYASKRQMQKDMKHITTATAAISEVTSYKVGDYVLCDWAGGGFTKRALPPSKLMTNRRGPLVVVSNIGADYSLLDLASGRSLDAHVSRLRPFRHDPLRTNPVEVCAKDHDQWLVECVTSHRGYNPQTKVRYDWTGKGLSKKVSELQLEVKWIGSAETTWENWSGNMNANTHAHEYMRKFPHLNRLIGQHFQEAYEASLEKALEP